MRRVPLSNRPVLSDPGEFILNAPLYDLHIIPDIQVIEPLLRGPILRFDGHCPHCKQYTTYLRQTNMSEMTWNSFIINKKLPDNIVTAKYVCSRNSQHVLAVVYEIDDSNCVQKIGQLPSLAQIAQDEGKKYRGVLRGEGASEYHKAVGLAAHGVGIGSFVYLRRIFERLVFGRFDEHKIEQGWKEEDFFKLRMDEKIAFLKDYLPDFLVQNRGIYGILSKGIHALSEKECLEFFPILKSSIVFILEDDQRKLDDLKRREEIAKALTQFKPSSGSSEN